MRGFKHFFSVPPVKTAALTVRGIGVQEHMPACIIDRPAGTGDHLFMFFYDPVCIRTGKTAAIHPPGTFMVWTPGRPHYYGNKERPFNHTWLHCNGTFIRGLVRSCRLPCNRPLPLGDPTVFERHLLDLHAELTTQSPPDHAIARNLLENCMRAIARGLKSKNNADAVPERMLSARHHLESAHAETITLPALAARAGMSVSHFCAEFKKYFGTAPIEYLIHQRMHQAAYLLSDRAITISEAGQRAGYEDLFHFSKLFKKHFGVSPRQWRANLPRGGMHGKPPFV